MSSTRAADAMRRLTEAEGPLDFGPDRSRLFVRVIRTLAEGRPISTEQLDRIIAHLGIAPEEAHRFVREWTERDHEGNVVGLGLTLNETAHRFSTGGVGLWTWCALDALIFAVVLDRSASVESVSPVTGEPTRLRVSPTRVDEVSPAGAVVSIPIVAPEAANLGSVEAIWGTFCHHSFFFPTPAEAQQWATGRENIDIVSVAEGFAIGHQIAASLLAYGA